MKVSALLAATGAILALGASAALAAECCEGCKDMAGDTKMACCDERNVEPAPTAPVPPAPVPSDAPLSQSLAGHP